jgi:predicted nucleotidyltransferase
LRTEQSIAHFLLGRARAEVLGALLLRPERPLHVRELARLTATSPGSLHRELRALERIGLLVRESVGRNVLYRCNPRHPLVPELAGLLRKTSGLVDVLRRSLEPLRARIKYAFVYGSIAAGTERPGSDVDVMIIGSAGFADVVNATIQATAELGREVNPTPMTAREFGEKLAENGFVRRIMATPRLWLIGDEDEFGELAANGAAAATPAGSRRNP